MKRFFNRYLQKCRADKRWILLPAAALLLLVLIIIACVFFRPVKISEAYAFSLDETSAPYKRHDGSASSGFYAFRRT